MIGTLVQWDTSGISVFFFPRSSIPADIQAQAPQPSTWGLAMARWPAINCDPFKFFYDHVAIFDTTLWYVLFYFNHQPRTLLTKICTAAVTGPVEYGPRQEGLVKHRAAPL